MADATTGQYSVEQVPDDLNPFEEGGAKPEPATFDPSQLLTEADKVRAHVAFLKAQGNPVTAASSLFDSADPNLDSARWRQDAGDLLIKQGKWNGLGEPPTAALASLAPGLLAGRAVGGILGLPQTGASISHDYSHPQDTSVSDTDGDDTRALSIAANFGVGAGVMPKPEGSLGMFGGQMAKTADIPALAAAAKEHLAGVDSASTWASHGWFKDADGQWKHEISDADAQFHPLLDHDVGPGQLYKLGDALQHPDLYSAYPELKDYNLGFGATGNNRGWFEPGHPDGPTIQLNPADNKTEQLSTTLHEIQHAVQGKEGFGLGAGVERVPQDVQQALTEAHPEYTDLTQRFVDGENLSPEETARLGQLHQAYTQHDAWNDAAFKRYQSSQGETEARNVQNRFGMTPEEMAAHHPDVTADVAPADRIVNREGIQGFESTAPAPAMALPQGLGKNGKQYLKDYSSQLGGDYEPDQILKSHMEAHIAGASLDPSVLDKGNTDDLNYHLGLAKQMDQPPGFTPQGIGPNGQQYLKTIGQQLADTPGQINLSDHVLSHKEGAPYKYLDDLTPEQKDQLAGHVAYAKSADAAPDVTSVAPDWWKKAAAIPDGWNKIAGVNDDLSSPPTTSPSSAWSPAAKQHLWDEQDFHPPHSEPWNDLQKILVGGPGQPVNPHSVFGGLHASAELLHNMEGKIDASSAEASPPDLGGASPAQPGGWNKPAMDYLQSEHDAAKDSYNHTLAGQIKDLMAAPGGPNGNSPKPAAANYWKMFDLFENATDKHDLVHPKSTADLASHLDYDHQVSLPLQEKIAAHVKPLDWASYRPEGLPENAPSAAIPAHAAALGFNPNVPILKGMEWHDGGRNEYGGKEPVNTGLGPTGGFADPASKPNERAIFATHDPKVANLYNGYDPSDRGYNMAPMVARADKALQVHWPDISPDESYNSATMQALINHARDQGADALVIHNIGDVGGRQTQYAFTKPNVLRSRFAKFDPSALDSSDLMRSGGLGVPATQPSDSRRKSVIVHLNSGENQ